MMITETLMVVTMTVVEGDVDLGDDNEDDIDSVDEETVMLTLAGGNRRTGENF